MYGIVTSTPDTGVAVAVKVIDDVASSARVSEDNANVTTAASSLSSIVATISELSLNVPFVGVPGVIIIVSSSSSLSSSVAVKVIVPVVSPAAIFSSVDN